MIYSKKFVAEIYSDEELAEKMQKEGFVFARRTIAKYREQLNIPVSRVRKESR